MFHSTVWRNVQQPATTERKLVTIELLFFPEMNFHCRMIVPRYREVIVSIRVADLAPHIKYAYMSSHLTMNLLLPVPLLKLFISYIAENGYNVQTTNQEVFMPH